MSRTLLLLVLGTVACQGAETGLDKSTLTGTVVIPPVSVEESDRASANNDSVTAPQGVGEDGGVTLTYRAVTVTGGVDDFGVSAVSGEPKAPDCYGFNAVADGEFTVWFNYDASGAGSKTADAVVYVVELIDPASFDAETGAGILWSETTDGYGGAYTATFDVVGGADYTLRVYGLSSEAGTEGSYELIFSGSTPQDDTVLVGAYLGDDPSVSSNPVGGTTANGWVWDEATLTWSGVYTALFIRSVEIPADADTGDTVFPDPIVNEEVASVYLRAATFGTLNDGLNAGTLYASTSIPVSLNHAEMTIPETIVLDSIAPKVIGVQATETEPDDTFADVEISKDGFDYELDSSTVVAQDIGLLTGLGYVDIIEGNNDLSTGAEGWDKNDSDAFAFTVDELMYARISLGWADPAADIDVMLVGPYEGYDYIDYAFGGCAYINNPEVCETYLPVEPGFTYYVVVLGYLGTDVQPYHFEVEWLAP